MTPEELGQAWLKAFNAHDVEALVSLYADNCTHTSPKLRVQHPETGGKISGKAALREWWAEAMKRLPGLQYEATAITANSERVVLEYLRHNPGDADLPVSESFDVRFGKIVASRVFHG